jgi:hypothetical protein
MYQSVVCVSAKRYFGKRSCHPPIKCIVQKQVRQQWRNNTTLRRASISPGQRTILPLHRHSEPTFDIQQHPLAVRVTPNSFHQKSMVDLVKQAPDVELQHPVVPPAPFAGDLYGLMSRLARSIAVRVLMKIWLDLRFQDKLHHRLSYPIRNGRNPKGSLSPRLLRYRNSPYRRRKITPGGHAIPNPIQVVAERSLKLGKGLLVNTGCSTIGLYSLVCFPYKPLWNFKRLCRRHSFLPLRVDKCLQQGNLTPWLRIHYRPFIATTSQSAPALRFGTLSLERASFLAISLNIAVAGSCSSAQEPGPSSRHLYAGHRPPSKQVPDGLVPRQYHLLGFDVV